MTNDRPGSTTPDRGDATPPADLPLDPRTFWLAGADPGDPPHSTAEGGSALQALGPLALPGCRFPLMGFLATVYEQASGHARDLAGTDR